MKNVNGIRTAMINTRTRGKLCSHPGGPQVVEHPAAQRSLVVAQVLGDIVFQIFVLQVGYEIIDRANGAVVIRWPRKAERCRVDDDPTGYGRGRHRGLVEVRTGHGDGDGGTERSLYRLSWLRGGIFVTLGMCCRYNHSHAHFSPVSVSGTLCV